MPSYENKDEALHTNDDGVGVHTEAAPLLGGPTADNDEVDHRHTVNINKRRWLGLLSVVVVAGSVAVVFVNDGVQVNFQAKPLMDVGWVAHGRTIHFVDPVN